MPRWSVALAEGWGGTTIVWPEGIWCNALTGEMTEGGERAASTVFKSFPLALWYRKEPN
jgi:maltooligosyltrehalose synthase